MTGSWVSLFKLGLTMLLVAGLITSIAWSVGAKDRVMIALEDEYTLRESLQDYRKYNAYDSKVLRGASVISLILQEQGGSVGIQVRTKSPVQTVTWYYTLSSGIMVPKAVNNIDAVYLQTLIRLNTSYNASIAYTANGNVGVISFVEV